MALRKRGTGDGFATGRYTELLVMVRPADTRVSIGVLLAGGVSRRAGVDKRYLVLEGRTLLRRNLDVLRALFPTVAVSVRDAGQLREPLPGDVEVLADIAPGSPLAGISTALTRFGAPVFVLAADIAFADPAAVARVLDAFAGVDVAMPVVGDHLEPLHAVYGPGLPGPDRRAARPGSAQHPRSAAHGPRRRAAVRLGAPVLQRQHAARLGCGAGARGRTGKR